MEAHGTLPCAFFLSEREKICVLLETLFFYNFDENILAKKEMGFFRVKWKPKPACSPKKDGGTGLLEMRGLRSSGELEDCRFYPWSPADHSGSGNPFFRSNFQAQRMHGQKGNKRIPNGLRKMKFMNS